MRKTLTVLLLLLTAPALHAQVVQPGAAAPLAHSQPIAEPLPTGTEEAPAAPAALRQPAAGEQRAAAAEPIFDRAFWRSVLAGVIASVLTAVILRVIL